MVQKSNPGPQDKDMSKDRESGDVKSSVRAPAKKDGKGGGYTWEGGADDMGLESPHSPDEVMGKVIKKGDTVGGYEVIKKGDTVGVGGVMEGEVFKNNFQGGMELF